MEELFLLSQTQIAGTILRQAYRAPRLVRMCLLRCLRHDYCIFLRRYECFSSCVRSHQAKCQVFHVVTIFFRIAPVLGHLFVLFAHGEGAGVISAISAAGYLNGCAIKGQCAQGPIFRIISGGGFKGAEKLSLGWPSRPTDMELPNEGKHLTGGQGLALINITRTL